MNTELSHRWRYGVVSVAQAGLGVLIWIVLNTHKGDVGTPIPARVVDMNGQTANHGLVPLVILMPLTYRHAYTEEAAALQQTDGKGCL